MKCWICRREEWEIASLEYEDWFKELHGFEGLDICPICKHFIREVGLEILYELFNVLRYDENSIHDALTQLKEKENAKK